MIDKTTSIRVNIRDNKQLSAMLDKANVTGDFEHRLTISALFRKFVRRCIKDRKFYKDFIDEK